MASTDTNTDKRHSTGNASPAAGAPLSAGELQAMDAYCRTGLLWNIMRRCPPISRGIAPRRLRWLQQASDPDQRP
jgi:hypothetical protein